MATTYKRDDKDFKAKLAARANELRNRRVIRPYSPTISQQFVHLAEDKELADIRLEQIKLSPIISKPKKTSLIGPILFVLVLLIGACFGIWGFAIALFLVCLCSPSRNSGRVYIFLAVEFP
jgi:hypothetical protein